MLTVNNSMRSYLDRKMFLTLIVVITSFATVLVVTADVTQDIVKRKGSLVSQIGKKTVLTKENLLIQPQNLEDPCDVTVLHNEALDGQAGMLLPSKFPCNYKEGSVMYENYGMPNVYSDNVKLLIRYTHNNIETYTFPVILPVSFIGQSKTSIVTIKSKLHVDKFNGYSEPLTKAILDFKYDRNSQRCQITMVNGATTWPKYGNIVNNSATTVMADCDDFLSSSVVYRHTAPSSPKVDYVPAHVNLFNKSHGGMVDQEWFALEISIDEGIENQPPKFSALSLLQLQVNQFIMTAITPSILSAEDDFTPAKQLVFRVSDTLNGGFLGALVSTDDQTLAIRSFCQADLERLKIAYRPPDDDSPVERTIRIPLQVFDGEGLASLNSYHLVVTIVPKDTRAPIIVRNSGLQLFEGETRRIHAQNLQVADEDNLKDVQFCVQYGLRHGRINIPSGRSFFTAAELNLGSVTYTHDHSDTMTDNIVFKASDGTHEVEFVFPITIFPLDDSAPVLQVNTGLRIYEGMTFQISSIQLGATDPDSIDSKIQYVLVQPFSRIGHVVLRRKEPEDHRGWTRDGDIWEKKVTDWTQQDINDGYLHYKHTSQRLKEPSSDKVRFKLRDNHAPPNTSPTYIFSVRVLARDTNPPQLAKGASLHMIVEENNITAITQSVLSYIDEDVKERHLTFNIIALLQSDDDSAKDVGAFVYTDRTDVEVIMFTQAEVMQGRISYKPPKAELGLVPRIIGVEFSVQDVSGNILPDQKMTIFIKPVDNRPPVIRSGEANVTKNGYVVITPAVLDASDIDTSDEKLSFIIENAPKFGTVKLQGMQARAGSVFSKMDLSSGGVVYSSTGGDSLNDMIVIDVTDGVHHIPVHLRINILKGEDAFSTTYDEGEALVFTLEVPEGNSLTLTSDLLPRSSASADLLLSLQTLPIRGSVSLQEFSLNDIQERKVFYTASGREIGVAPLYDSFNLTVVRGSIIVNWLKIPNVFVRVTILPVDNTPPVLSLGQQIKLPEAGITTFTTSQLNVMDVDSEMSNIICTITTQPEYGYLELSSPAVGSELPRSGQPISTFTALDLNKGNVNYRQSVYEGLEPQTDRFDIICFDGINRNNQGITVPISITPTNDEKPQVHANDFVVEEGKTLQIDLPILNVLDNDFPPDLITFKVVKKPVNGRILQNSPNGVREVTEFTFDDIRFMSKVAYQHNDTETTNDSFALEVSDGLHSVRKEIPIRILPLDDEVPEVIVNKGLYIEAKVDRPEWKYITAFELKAEDIDSPNGNITFKIRQQPVFGFLQRRLDALGNFWDNITRHMTFQQWEIDESLIRYVHSGRYGIRDIIKLDVSDQARNSQIDKRFYITVEALDKMQPDIVNRGLELPESQSVILTTSMLSAWDDRSSPEGIVFTITSKPSLGRLELVTSPGKELTNFTQVDLAAGRIRYVHGGDDKSLSDGFEFEVTDGFNPVYRAFSISILPVDNQMPVLMIQPIRLREKGTAYITPNQLMARDRDTPSNLLTFYITSPPKLGTIRRSGETTSTFTQNDLENGLITYVHDGREALQGEMLLDRFSIRVTDGTHSKFFVYPELSKPTRKYPEVTIQIAAVDDSIPQLFVNEPATHLTKQGTDLIFTFTNRHLRVKDADTKPEYLIFWLINKPQYGKLVTGGSNAVSSWTQVDIDQGQLKYILNEGAEESADHFTFRVQDGGGNEIPSVTFTLSWSFISFQDAMIEVQESSGYAEVLLKRIGALKTTAFVTVTVRDVTTMAGEDYSKVYSKQVQFNAGEYEKYWRLQLVNDTLYEQKEMLTLELSDPVNAAIQQHDWCTVTIRDEEDRPVVALNSSATIEITEGIGRASFLVRRSGDLQTEVVAVCNFREGSAKGTGHPAIYTDFILRSSAVRFTVGQKEARCFVDIIDDSYIEPAEEFTVFIEKVEGGILGSISSAQVRIMPDSSDLPVIKFQTSQYHVTEGEGSVSVLVQRSGGDLSKESEVMIISKPIGERAAQPMVDYIPVSLLLTFAPSEMIKPVKVILLDDRSMPMVEGEETFALMLKFPNATSLGHPNTTIVTISDELDAPEFAFVESKHVVPETNGSLDVILRRYGDVNSAQRVYCITVQQTAIAGQDFVPRLSTSQSSIINFLSGQSEGVCRVLLVNDLVYEGAETFELQILTETGSETKSIALVTLTDEEDVPVITFTENQQYVSEPSAKGEVSIVKITVRRQGDTSKTSIVRVSTKDGSARSGVDYTEHSSELVFNPGVKEREFEVSIVYDGSPELRESLSVLISPDSNSIASLGISRMSIFITDENSIAGLVFPVDPIVVSLKFYDSIKLASDPPQGYPLVCITPCDERHPEYPRAKSICDAERIDVSLTTYRWKVGEPIGRDGLAFPTILVTSNTFMTRTDSPTLDSIYFGPGSRVQCLATPSSSAMVGLERESPIITVSRVDGVCRPSRAGFAGGEQYLSKVKYLEPDHKRYPSHIKLSISIPHRDGMMPAISTSQLSNFEFMLSPDASRIGLHRCSNLLVSSETKLVGWVGRKKADKAFLPYQHDRLLRGDNAVNFYSNLDLENCFWEFDGYFKLPELINECGANIETNSQVQDLTKSYVSLVIPLYVSFIFHSSSAPGGWLHFDTSSRQRVTFVYDTAKLLQHGVENIQSDNQESSMSARLYLHSVRIQTKGHLIVDFQTQPNFYGMFVTRSDRAQSRVMSYDLPGLNFDLALIHSDETFERPKQLWQFSSQSAVQDYTGKYNVSLVPCTAPSTQPFSLPVKCTHQRPLTFELNIELQQVSDPVAEVFSLNTELMLTRNRRIWLSENKTSGDVSDVNFRAGEKIYGRVDSHQLQGDESPYDVQVEKVFICTGRNGFVPKYQPDAQQYGCVAQSGQLQAQYKILDKVSPDLVTKDLDGVPFNAKFAEEDKRGRKLFKSPGTDGFYFDSKPLAVDTGRKWFVHVIYSVNTLTDPTWRMRVRRETAEAELKEVGYNKGTNMAFLYLEPPSDIEEQNPELQTVSEGPSWVIAVTVVSVLFAVVVAAMLVTGYKLRQQRRSRNRQVNKQHQTTELEIPIDDEPRNRVETDVEPVTEI